MKYQLKSWLALGVIISVTVLAVFIVVGVANKDLADNKELLVDLYQVEHNIKEANAAIREAALAHTDFLIEEELKRLAKTTASSSEILNRLPNDPRLSKQDKAALEVIRTERVEYKQVQSNVLVAIRAHDRHAIWDNIQVYRKYQEKYSKRIDDLILIHENKTGDIKDRLFFRLVLMVALLSGLQLADKYYTFHRWKLKHHSCVPVK